MYKIPQKLYFTSFSFAENFMDWTQVGYSPARSLPLVTSLAFHLHALERNGDHSRWLLDIEGARWLRLESHELVFDWATRAGSSSSARAKCHLLLWLQQCWATKLKINSVIRLFFGPMESSVIEFWPEYWVVTFSPFSPGGVPTEVEPVSPLQSKSSAHSRRAQVDLDGNMKWTMVVTTTPRIAGKSLLSLQEAKVGLLQILATTQGLIN